MDDNYEKIYNNGSNKNSFENLNRSVRAISGIEEDVLKPLEKEYLDNNLYKFKVDTDSDYIYLTVDYEDWKIRCKSTNEPEINYIENVKVFDESFDYLKKLHFPVLKCNTSKYSPYEIAKIIINEIERYNRGYEVST